jgi:imidazole glycerol-phosphate synthase subunit HisF
MLQKRIIVCLDVRDGKTTKGVRFKGNRDIGDPVLMAEEYYKQGVDELVFYDITASSEKRDIMIDLVRKVAEKIFIPFSVGGGIRTLEDMKKVILAGAEKVSVNTSAVLNPSIISEGADYFGRQCIVVGMDVEADSSKPSGYGIVINGGRTRVNLDALEWAEKVEKLGAGEIVLNSIDADGTKNGYELKLTRMISLGVGIPVVASGGAGASSHLVDVFQSGKADAALIASMVHIDGYTIGGIKNFLKKENIPVRL